MPRDRGYRDPNLVNLPSDFLKFWSRVVYRQDANAQISRLSRKRYDQLLSKVHRAQACYRGKPTPFNPGEAVRGLQETQLMPLNSIQEQTSGRIRICNQR